LRGYAKKKFNVESPAAVSLNSVYNGDLTERCHSIIAENQREKKKLETLK